MERRGGGPVYHDGKIIGQTTSAAYGYRVGAPVAIAMLSPLDSGTDVEVDIGGLRYPATIVDGAIYRAT